MPSVRELLADSQPISNVRSLLADLQPLPSRQGLVRGPSLPEPLGETTRDILGGAYESIIGRGLRKTGIVPELAPEDRPSAPEGVVRKLLVGLGQIGPDLPLYALSGGLAAGAGAGPILSSATAFGVPGAIRETLGEKPTLGSIAKETAKEATLGATLGGISRFAPKGTKFPLEVGAFAEAQALERGEVVPSKEEFLTSGLFLGGLKGLNKSVSALNKSLEIFRKKKGAKRAEPQAPLKEEEIIETPPQASIGAKPTIQQPSAEGVSKAGEAPKEFGVGDAVLVGGKSKTITEIRQNTAGRRFYRFGRKGNFVPETKLERLAEIPRKTFIEEPKAQIPPGTRLIKDTETGKESFVPQEKILTSSLTPHEGTQTEPSWLRQGYQLKLDAKPTGAVETGRPPQGGGNYLLYDKNAVEPISPQPPTPKAGEAPLTFQEVEQIKRNVDIEEFELHGKALPAVGRFHFGEPTTKLGKELISVAGKDYTDISILAQASKSQRVRSDAQRFIYALSDRVQDSNKIPKLIQLRDSLNSSGTAEGKLISNAINKITSKAGEPTLSGGRPGEFTPEEADAFRRMEIAQQQAQDALQAGDRATFDKFNAEIKGISEELSGRRAQASEEKLRKIEGRPDLMDVTPEEQALLQKVALPKERFSWSSQDEIFRTTMEARGWSQKDIDVLLETISKEPGFFSGAIANEHRQVVDLVKVTNTLPGLEDLLAKKAVRIGGATSEIARTMQRMKEKSLPFKESQEILAFIKKMNPQQRAEVEERLAKFPPEDYLGKMRFISSLKQPKAMDYIYEWYYSSILSGPPTHLINTINTAYWVGFQMPFGALRSLVEIPVAKFQGRPREFFPSEVRAEWAGVKVGLKRGIAKIFELIRTRKMPSELTKWQREVKTGAFERSSSAFLRRVGKVLSIPTKALTLEDAFFRSIAYEQKFAGLAMRQAIKDARAGLITKQEIPSRAGVLVAKPTNEMIVGAGKFMDYATFNDAPNKVAEAVLKLRETVPGSRFLLPFVNTVSNLFTRGLEIAPGIGIAIRGKAGLQGPELSTTVASQIVGGIVTTYIVLKYLDGEITGGLPSDKAEREAWYRQGKLPWATKWGDDYYSWARLEPFNTAMSAVTSVLDAWTQHGEGPTPELIGHMFAGMGRRLLDASYLSQFSDFITSVEKGERGVEALKRMGLRQASSMIIPFSSFVRSLERGVEGQERGEVLVRQPQGLGEQLKTNIPFLAEEVPARREVFGEPASIPGGAFRQLLPFKKSEETKDPTELELRRLKLNIGMPSQKLKGIELEREDYDALVKQEGPAIKAVLDRIVSAPGWGNIPDVFKRLLIERTVSQIREPMGEAFFLKLATEKPDYVREKAQSAFRRGQRLPIPLTPLGIQ